MDEPRVCHCWVKAMTEKDRYMRVLICGIKKDGTDKLIFNTQSHKCRKQTYELPRGKKGINWEIGIDIYTLLYIK